MKFMTLNGVRQVCPECGRTVRQGDDMVVCRIGRPPAALFHYLCYAQFMAKAARDAIITGQTEIRQ